MTALLAVQAITSLSLAGLVWFVQLVHYPLFARVDAAAFAAYEREHTRRTTWIAVPLMLAEAGAATALVAADPTALTGAGFALVVAVWVSTAYVQVPCHRALESGWDPVVHRRLVTTNWARTVLWTARGAIAVWLLGWS